MLSARNFDHAHLEPFSRSRNAMFNDRWQHHAWHGLVRVIIYDNEKTWDFFFSIATCWLKLIVPRKCSFFSAFSGMIRRGYTTGGYIVRWSVDDLAASSPEGVNPLITRTELRTSRLLRQLSLLNLHLDSLLPVVACSNASRHYWLGWLENEKQTLRSHAIRLVYWIAKAELNAGGCELHIDKVVCILT